VVGSPVTSNTAATSRPPPSPRLMSTPRWTNCAGSILGRTPVRPG
jgi:hypothetical protein